MASRKPQLTAGEQTAIDSPSAVRTYLIGMPLVTPFATGQIDMSSVPWPTGDFDVDGVSADWADARIGMTVWIGDAPLTKNKGVYFIRKEQDTSHLYIGGIGQADAGISTLPDRGESIINDDYVTIWETYNLHAARSKIVYSYGDTTGTFYKFTDLAYTDQHEKPDCYFQGDTHKGYCLPVGDSTVAVSMSISGVPHLASQSVSSYAWTTPAVMTDVSGPATDTVSGNLPQGAHTLYCAVTLNDGTVTTAVRHILVWAETGDLQPTEVLTDINDTRDRTGRRLQVQFIEDLRGNLDTESMIMLVDEPVYRDGSVGTATVQFVGWLNSESFNVEFGKRGSTAEIIGVAAVLGSLGADSQRLEQAANPANFQQAPLELMTGTYFIWQLLRWGVVNWNALSGYYPIEDTVAQTVNPWDVPKGTYLSQIQNVGLRLKYANVGFDSDGDLHVAQHPSLVDPDSRSFVERGSLTADMYKKVTVMRNSRPENRLVIVGAFIYDGTTMQAIRAWAPSQITGQASGEDQLQNIIVFTQEELDLFAGLYYQKVNQTYLAITFLIPGNYDIIEAAHMQVIPFTIDAINSPTGIEISGYGIPQKAVKKRGENGETYIELTIEPLTSGTAGLPYPYPPKVDRPYGVSGLRSFHSRLPTSIGFGVQNNFSPATAKNPSNDIKDVVLVRNSGSTEFRVVRIDSITPAFKATDIGPTSGQRSALGPPVRLTRDPTNTSGYFLLCRDGIAYTANAAGRTVTWKIVTGTSTWTKTFDFTVNDGGWVAGTTPQLRAVYYAGVGWKKSAFRNDRITIAVTIPAADVTSISATVDNATGVFDIGLGNGSDIAYIGLSGLTATRSVSFPAETFIVLDARVSTTDDPAIVSVTLVGTGSGGTGVNIATLAVSSGGNIYWLSKDTVGGTDYVFCNYTRNGFKTVASTQVAKYDANLTYNIQISQYNPAYIWVSAGVPGDDAAIYFSSNGAVSFTAGASLNTRGGSFRVPRALPDGGSNRLSKNIVYVKGISTNLQGVRDGYSAATIATGSGDYPQTAHTLNSFPLDSDYVLVGLKSRDVYESHDGGKTWAFVATAPGSGNLYSLEVWPSNRNYLLVGGDQCLAYSIDRGATYTNLWSAFSTWAVAQYGSGVATVILNALPALWTIYKSPVN